MAKRCQLCGGKLSNHRCVECGLDNTKTDSNYKLNQSTCDGEPLTHVHDEVDWTKYKTTDTEQQEHPQHPQDIKGPKQSKQPKQPKQSKQAKKKPGRFIWILIVLIGILMANADLVRDGINEAVNWGESLIRNIMHGGSREQSVGIITANILCKRDPFLVFYRFLC